MAALHKLMATLVLGATGFRARMRRHRFGKPSAQLGPEDPVDIDALSKCHLSDSTCSIDSMSKATLIYTDSSDSRCWNGDPWAFLVHPGARDKLLFYFPGGGACWDQPNIIIPGSATLCFQDIRKGIEATGYGSGLMDLKKPGNPFSDYTVVSPAYCGGGIHIGNGTVKGLLGTNYQHDYTNSVYVKSWAQRNLASHLSSFVIMGSSAGSLGAAIWADDLLSSFSHGKGSVVLDSYAGVFPPGTQGPLLAAIGACDVPIMRPFQESCTDGSFEITDALMRTISKHPTVAFGHLQSKTDAVQRIFYGAVALSFLKLEVVLSQGKFQQRANDVLQVCNQYPNYAAYLVNGLQHVFIPYNHYWTSTVKGKDESSSGPTMSEWISRFVAHETVETECDGRVRRNGYLLGNYCDENLVPKTISL